MVKDNFLNYYMASRMDYQWCRINVAWIIVVEQSRQLSRHLEQTRMDAGGRFVL